MGLYRIPGLSSFAPERGVVPRLDNSSPEAEKKIIFLAITTLRASVLGGFNLNRSGFCPKFHHPLWEAPSDQFIIAPLKSTASFRRRGSTRHHILFAANTPHFLLGQTQPSAVRTHWQHSVSNHPFLYAACSNGMGFLI